MCRSINQALALSNSSWAALYVSFKMLEVLKVVGSQTVITDHRPYFLLHVKLSSNSKCRFRCCWSKFRMTRVKGVPTRAFLFLLPSFLPLAYPAATRLHDSQTRLRCSLIHHLERLVITSLQRTLLRSRSILHFASRSRLSRLRHGRRLLHRRQCGGRHFSRHHNLPRSPLILQLMGQPGPENKRRHGEHRKTTEQSQCP